MNRKWTEAEKNFIRQNAARVKDEDIARQLSRLTGRHVTLYAVRQCRLRMGIRKAHGRGVCRVRPTPPPNNSIGLVLSA